MEPKLVTEAPPRFRVQRIAHGTEADVEAALNAAAGDGYEISELQTQPNGDVLIVLEYAGHPAAPAEPAGAQA